MLFSMGSSYRQEARSVHVRNKCFLLVLVVICVTFFFLVRSEISAATGNTVKRVSSCLTCHAGFSSLLPSEHSAVTGKDIKACTSCHVVKVSEAAEIVVFSSKIHRAHAGSDTGTECSLCHAWTPNKRFSVIGSTVSWGAVSKTDMVLLKKMFDSWAGSKYLDAIHARGDVMCSGCHGGVIPKEGDTVDNNRCLSCHGPIENLVAGTAPKDFPNRNPHKSHLGDIDCTVCHKSHEVSTVYCLQCHAKFNMKLPGSVDTNLQNNSAR
jgi:Cytochrome c3